MAEWTSLGRPTVGPIADTAVTTGSDGKTYINAANYNGGTTTLSGTATAGDTVSVSNGVNTYTATVTSAGSWTASISGLTNGQTYTFTATATDAEGNTAVSQPFSFTVDTAPPTVAITSAGSLTDKASQTISGTVSTTEAAAGGTVALYDNGVQIGTAALSGGGWSTTVTLPNQGANSITATDTDAAGNTGTSAAVTYTLETVAHTVIQTVANPATGDEGLGKTVTITLTFSEEVTVSGASPSLQLSDGGVASYATGSDSDQLTFTYTVGASNMNTSALAVTGVSNEPSVTDAAGNAANFNGANVTFSGLQVDTTVPAVTAIAASPSAAPKLWARPSPLP